MTERHPGVQGAYRLKLNLEEIQMETLFKVLTGIIILSFVVPVGAVACTFFGLSDAECVRISVIGLSCGIAAGLIGLVLNHFDK